MIIQQNAELLLAVGAQLEDRSMGIKKKDETLDLPECTGRGRALKAPDPQDNF